MTNVIHAELMAAMGAQPLAGLTEEGFKAMVEVSISQVRHQR